ncbi:bacterioferritin [Ectothiorhodospiraceae bacterium BW-2]|nr:bacterioferritin [Ectothiorhodospiraceae bacterium BW-2]
MLGYLGRALSLEFSAVQLYTAQARLVSGWGLLKDAERLAAEAKEEMEHIERIIARMLSVGVAPSASQLRPVRLGTQLAELVLVAIEFEQELVRFYSEAVSYCQTTPYSNDTLFFQQLLQEELNHSHELGQWYTQLTAPTAADNRRSYYR